jgi:hypothetical protein
VWDPASLFRDDDVSFLSEPEPEPAPEPETEPELGPELEPEVSFEPVVSFDPAPAPAPESAPAATGPAPAPPLPGRPTIDLRTPLDLRTPPAGPDRVAPGREADAEAPSLALVVNRSTPQEAPAPRRHGPAVAEALRELNEQRVHGIISEKEFKRRQAELFS